MQHSKVNGKEIEHLDVIRREAKGLKLSIVSRFKILFGIPFNIDVKIYTNNQHCHVIDSEIKLTTDKILYENLSYTKFTVPARVKELYKKWHNSIYRSILAFIACFYSGYMFLFEKPEKYPIAIKVLGVFFVIRGVEFLIELYLKYLLNWLSKNQN